MFQNFHMPASPVQRSHVLKVRRRAITKVRVTLTMHYEYLVGLSLVIGLVLMRTFKIWLPILIIHRMAVIMRRNITDTIGLIYYWSWDLIISQRNSTYR